MEIVQNNMLDEIYAFTEFIFSLTNSKNHQDFSSKLLEAHENGNNLTAKIQDQVLNSNEFKKTNDHY